MTLWLQIYKYIIDFHLSFTKRALAAAPSGLNPKATSQPLVLWTLRGTQLCQPSWNTCLLLTLLHTLLDFLLPLLILKLLLGSFSFLCLLSVRQGSDTDLPSPSYFPWAMSPTPMVSVTASRLMMCSLYLQLNLSPKLCLYFQYFCLHSLRNLKLNLPALDVFHSFLQMLSPPFSTCSKPHIDELPCSPASEPPPGFPPKWVAPTSIQGHESETWTTA